jgi:hypothetical protein
LKPLNKYDFFNYDEYEEEDCTLEAKVLNKPIATRGVP